MKEDQVEEEEEGVIEDNIILMIPTWVFTMVQNLMILALTMEQNQQENRKIIMPRKEDQVEKEEEEIEDHIILMTVALTMEQGQQKQ